MRHMPCLLALLLITGEPATPMLTDTPAVPAADLTEMES